MSVQTQTAPSTQTPTMALSSTAQISFTTPITNDLTPKPYPKYTVSEVSQHNNDASLWIIANSSIYDVTSFADEHPGGRKIMQTVAGRDATKQVNKYHRPSIIKRHEARLKIGEIDLAPPKKGLGRLFGFGKK